MRDHPHTAWMMHSHDLRLVALALLICAIASLTMFDVLERARTNPRRAPWWIALAGTIAGIGVWSTHFIAMLSFAWGTRPGYDPGLTFLSAIVGTSGTIVGLSLAMTRTRASTLTGAAFLTLGIAGLHYIGMSAIRGAAIAFDPGLTSLSIVASWIAAAAALRFHRTSTTILPWRAAGALCLAVAAIHFGGMAATTVLPDSAGAGHELVFDTNALVALVLTGSLLVIGSGFAVALLDRVADREQAASAIAHLAFRDRLTGLHNRSVLEDRLAQDLDRARATRSSLAVICIDLDGFKGVNDNYGHATGDALLVEVAQRLQVAVRPEDLVARIGGDEFVVVQLGCAQPRCANTVAERVIAALKCPFEIAGQSITIGGSAGIALYPDDGRTAEELAKRADYALYHAKASGKNAYRFFDAQLEAAMDKRQQLEFDLRSALDKGQLRLLYQPVIDIRSGRTIAQETLLRWRREDGVDVSPDEFIVIAEQNGSITEIDMWTLRMASADARGWPAHQRLCVNFSAAHFLKPDLADRVLAILAETDFPASRLVIEVTETVLLSKRRETVALFDRLRSHGIAIALDDFGTGYSSLAYFGRFRFDKIKIDKSFVRGLRERWCKEVVTSIIMLSHNLGMSVVAEGIETIEQYEALKLLGCDEAQGYLIGRPVPLERMTHISAPTALPNLSGPTETRSSNAA